MVHAEPASRQLTSASINKRILRQFPVPVAPLNEQRRIVAKIEELFSDLDAGVAALERAKANLKRYRAAVLKAAVEGKLTAAWRAKHPNVEPASKLLDRILTERRRKWEADQLAKFAAAGKQPPKNWQAKYVEPTPPDTTDLPELPARLVLGEARSASRLPTQRVLPESLWSRDRHADSADKRRPANECRSFRSPISRRDRKQRGRLLHRERRPPLYSVQRQYRPVGRCGDGARLHEKVLHPDKLIRVKLALGDPMPSFVEIAANVGASRKHMVGRARTTAGQTGISGTDIREMPIPLPPRAEQAQIVAEVAEKLSQIDAAAVAIDHGLLRAARLRQSILKQAFEGKLVPQDPADEPANVLLERLRTQPSHGPRHNGRASPRKRGPRSKAVGRE